MDGNPKQMIVERIKGATNILVTVSRNPSVDSLAAMLALTLMINKMDKHATAVFSGQTPPAISFLEPGKTFENSVSSLRDFIIALDKEKADRLRYKVEDDVVRIYITPYRTTITQDDLNFSQGDFNVDLIIALGVEKRDDIDGAIAAHGRILHDASVATINPSTQVSSLGNIDWSDGGASSLCEMLMSLSEALQSGLLDQQIASALLTGIVAATDRFSNPHTNPKVMTMAAQLMAAGANQQLIAANLETGNALSAAPAPASRPDQPQHLPEGDSAKLDPRPAAPSTPPVPDGLMAVAHEMSAPPTVANLPPPVFAPESAVRPAVAESPFGQFPGIDQDQAEPPLIGKAKVSDWRDATAQPPLMGGALSATADQAQKDKVIQEAADRNHTILTHDTFGNSSQSVNQDAASRDFPETVDPFAQAIGYEETPLRTTPPKVVTPTSGTVPEADSAVPVAPPMTIAELEEQARHRAGEASPFGPIDNARAAVDAAFQSPPPFEAPALSSAPVEAPGATLGLPTPPPLPDFSTLPSLPPLPGEAPALATPVTPAFPNIPLQPVETPPAAPNDFGQFKIPGQ